MYFDVLQSNVNTTLISCVLQYNTKINQINLLRMIFFLKVKIKKEKIKVELTTFCIWEISRATSR